MNLQADILRTEIAKLKQERMTDSVATQLSVYWCALQAVKDEQEPPEQAKEVRAVRKQTEPLEPVFDGEGAFHNAVRGKKPEDVYNVLEQFFGILAAVDKSRYNAVMSALDKI